MFDRIADDPGAWDTRRMERELRKILDNASRRRLETKLSKEIFRLIRQRARLVRRAHKRIKDHKLFLTRDEAIALAQRVAAIVVKHVPDLDTRRAIAVEAGSILSGPDELN